MARPSVEIETIEVLAHPSRVVRERIFMLPAIIVGEKRWFDPPSLTEMIAVLDNTSD